MRTFRKGVDRDWDELPLLDDMQNLAKLFVAWAQKKFVLRVLPAASEPPASMPVRSLDDRRGAVLARLSLQRERGLPPPAVSTIVVAWQLGNSAVS